MRYIVILIAIGFLLPGCTQDLDELNVSGITGEVEGAIEEEKDEHGCIPSAGYVWCESKQKCILPFEEACEPIVEDKTPDTLPVGDSALTQDEAKAIAENSPCMEEGILTGTPSYAPAEKSWFFSIELYNPMEGCMAGCFVYEENRSAKFEMVCIEQTSKLTEEEARALAEASECNTKTKLTDAPGVYDATAELWRFETESSDPRCYCMVVEFTEAAGLYWECPLVG